MTFETPALIAFCIIVLFAAILYRIRQWYNSICVETNILGYKWYKKNKITGFSPVVEFENDGGNIKVPVRELNLLIPERKVQLRISKSFEYSVKTDVTHLIFLLTLILFISYTIYAPNGQNSGNLLLFIVMSYVIALIFKLVRNIKNIGRANIMFFMPASKRPEHYEKMTEDDFKKIEERDLVTYEEAMAHYYHNNKKSEKWLYPIAIAVVLYLLYRIFF